MVPLLPHESPPTREVWAPDLPGFGRSNSPRAQLNVPRLGDALAEWMRKCGIEDAVLLGNSSGCQVAVELAV
jgi:pimeloyl-ACP methyl ester carboxylesterase